MKSATISNLYKDCKITEIWDNITHEKIGLQFVQENDISISDEYHSMDELYEHRYALFAALTKVYDNYKTPLGSHVVCWKSKLHQDGTMFENSFIAGMTVHKMDTTVEYITYHMPIEWWDKFDIMQYEHAPEWDGHTSEDVIERLLRL
jgi:hypothetical protein